MVFKSKESVEMNTGCKEETPVDLFGDKEKYFTCWPNLGCLFQKDKFQEMSLGCRQGGVKLATAVTNGSSDVAQSINVE